MSNVMEHFDLAFISLYVFWGFFAGLVYWIRICDRREGYPLEREDSGWQRRMNGFLMPKPKEYLLADGTKYVVPNKIRDTRDHKIRPSAPYQGVSYIPTGNPMLDGVGPASYTERHDHPELTITGENLIVPMRIAEGFKISKGSGDPRGTPVECFDGTSVGVVKDLWVDRADYDVRYLEVELESDSTTRLLPMPMAHYNRRRNKINVASIRSTQFADVPTIKNPDQVTVLEEDKIMAYFGSGHLYAIPSRLGPLL